MRLALIAMSTVRGSSAPARPARSGGPRADAATVIRQGRPIRSIRSIVANFAPARSSRSS
jgi:hypothetical protein